MVHKESGHHWPYLAIVAIVAVVAVVVVVLNSNPSDTSVVVDEDGNIVGEATATGSRFTDTDGGKKPIIKGTVILSASGSSRSYPDTCDGATLIERSCDKGSLKSERLSCPDWRPSCTDGVCVPTCGNNILDHGEICDDGNTHPIGSYSGVYDSCSSDCKGQDTSPSGSLAGGYCRTAAGWFKDDCVDSNHIHNYWYNPSIKACVDTPPYLNCGGISIWSGRPNIFIGLSDGNDACVDDCNDGDQVIRCLPNGYERYTCRDHKFIEPGVAVSGCPVNQQCVNIPGISSTSGGSPYQICRPASPCDALPGDVKQGQCLANGKLQCIVTTNGVESKQTFTCQGTKKCWGVSAPAQGFATCA